MSMNQTTLKNIIEAAMLAAGTPLSIDRMLALFVDDNQPSRNEIRDALTQLESDYEERGIQLKEVSSGFRIQVKSEMAPWISRMWEERAPRYSRAMLETLALIAYRQPITRAEIEDVRGVAVSSNIIKTMMEREWIRVIGHRDVPGKPALYATTKEFLDYFNMKSLDELPSLMELRDIDSINAELNLQMPNADADEGDAVDSSEGSEVELPAVEVAEPETEAETEAEAETEEIEAQGESENEISDDASEEKLQADLASQPEEPAQSTNNEAVSEQ